MIASQRPSDGVASGERASPDEAYVFKDVRPRLHKWIAAATRVSIVLSSAQILLRMGFLRCYA